MRPNNVCEIRCCCFNSGFPVGVTEYFFWGGGVGKGGFKDTSVHIVVTEVCKAMLIHSSGLLKFI